MCTAPKASVRQLPETSLCGERSGDPAHMMIEQSSRGVEGPGPMTLRQPTERHGGNARFDEETIMVSKTLASLDAWLALAEEVLAEQNARREKEPGAGQSHEFDQLPLFESDSV
jgi:hypothetical protein